MNHLFQIETQGLSKHLLDQNKDSLTCKQNQYLVQQVLQPLPIFHYFYTMLLHYLLSLQIPRLMFQIQLKRQKVESNYL